MFLGEQKGPDSGQNYLAQDKRMRGMGNILRLYLGYFLLFHVKEFNILRIPVIRT